MSYHPSPYSCTTINKIALPGESVALSLWVLKLMSELSVLVSPATLCQGNPPLPDLDVPGIYNVWNVKEYSTTPLLFFYL